MDKRQVEKELRSRGLSDFRVDVLLAAYSIPRGQVRTYKQVAKMAGHPNAYRAVGTALKNNPMAPTVPCHRVIKSDGTLGRFSSPGGTKRKMQMLRQERAI